MTGGNVPSTFGSSVWWDKRVVFGKGVTIGHCSCIGAPAEDEDEDECGVGDGVRIGAFCTVTMGATIGDGVKMDPYCRVGASEVGEGTQLLYGARVHDDAKIGSRCIIGGNVPDRTVIGNDVRHFGRLTHIPRRGGSWDEDEDLAPIIGDRVLIGAGALVVGGVRIGDGASIEAGACVIGDGITVGAGAQVQPKRLVRLPVPAGCIVQHDMVQAV